MSSLTEFVAFPKMPRLKNETILITEKLDGTNAQIVVFETEDGEKDLLVGSRTRWIYPGKETDNYGFAAWCAEHKEELLKLPLGRHYGEWWGKGIQREYDLPERKLSLFNVRMVGLKEHISCIDFVPVLYHGPLSGSTLEFVLANLKLYGSVAAPGFMNPEGIIVRYMQQGVQYKMPFDPNPKGQ